MSNPQGSEVLNTAVFTAAEAQIAGCTSCATLQALVNQTVGDLNAFIQGLIDQNALLGPMQALLTAPTSPTAAVTWITNYITNVLTPQLAVYATYAAKATALATAVTNLTNAISTAESNIKGCSISIPTILPIPSF